MIMIIKLIFNFSNFCIIICFLTKLLTLGILFSTAVNAVFVAKLLISGILFSNSVSFICLTKSATSGIVFSDSDFQCYTYFLTQSHEYQYYLLLQPIYHTHFFNNIIFHYITQFTEINRNWC